MSLENEAKVHRLVLTGGPCSGKTTALIRLSQFFENIGWKVLRVPESAGIIIGCGISFYDLNEEQVEQIEEDIIKSILTLESACLNMAKLWNKPCLIVCDRGFMDCKAYQDEEMWQRILKKCNWNNIDFRDNRYDQVIHLVSSANGAHQFYQCSEIRTEGIELAVELDKLTSKAWLGHPNMSIIDNSTGFEEKINRLIHLVCKNLGIESEKNFNTRKVQFLIKSIPKDEEFPHFQDFKVYEDFDSQKTQTLSKRGQNDNWFYQISRCVRNDSKEKVEEKMLNIEEYERLLKQIDKSISVSCTERCFIWEDIYFRLFIYEQEFKGVIVLETETSLSESQLSAKVPSFLEVITIINNDKHKHKLQFLWQVFKYNNYYLT